MALASWLAAASAASLALFFVPPVQADGACVSAECGPGDPGSPFNPTLCTDPHPPFPGDPTWNGCWELAAFLCAAECPTISGVHNSVGACIGTYCGGSDTVCVTAIVVTHECVV